MKKTTRILCLAIAAVFVVSLLFSIAMSIAYAEEDTSASSRGETVYVTADANGNVERVISSVYLGNDQSGRRLRIIPIFRTSRRSPQMNLPLFRAMW